MKMKITYEEADIKRLVRNNLARQGIAATDADIEFKKNQVFVAVEVQDDDETVTPAAAAAVPAQAAASDMAPAPRDEAKRPPAPPPLEIVEGGNNPVDMSDIFRESQKVASQKGGMFPVPERTLMSGESYEFPGGKDK